MTSMFDNENTPPAVKRLITLLGAGYRIDESASAAVGDTIWLEHPAGRRAAEKTLLVYGDGWVIGVDPLDDSKKQLRIGPNDMDEFSYFVKRVPKSTWWERNNGPFYMGLGWAFLLAVAFVGTKLIDFVWSLFSGTNG